MANIRLTKNVLNLITKIISGQSPRQVVNAQTEPEPVRKTLITEKYIIGLNTNQKILVVEKDTIITPLAKDRAKAMGIKIEKRGGA